MSAGDSAVVIDIRRMTESELKSELARIDATYGKSSTEAGARRDQELAAVFYRSSWKQEELAKVVGKSAFWVSKRLLFGRFLGFLSDDKKSEFTTSKLTEGGFRKYWDLTKGNNEYQRFTEVLRQMAESTPAAKKRLGIGTKIIDEFGDGEWHRLEKIAEHVEQPPESLRELLNHLGQQNRRVALCEKRPGGKSFSYRIVKAGGRKIDLDALMQELEPILEIMEYQGAQHRAALSPSTVLTCTHNIRKLLKTLDQKTAPNR